MGCLRRLRQNAQGRVGQDVPAAHMVPTQRTVAPGPQRCPQSVYSNWMMTASTGPSERTSVA